MASSVTTQLTISSTNATSDSLSIVVNKTLATKEPIIGIARLEVGTTAVEVFGKAVAAITYVYLKNTHGTHTVTVSDGVAPTDFLTISPGEFAFIPVKALAGLQVKGSGTGCVVEYALFTKG